MEPRNISNSTLYQAANDIHIHNIDEDILKRLLKEALNEQNKQEDVKDIESEFTYKNLEKLKMVMNSGKSFTIYDLAIQLGLSKQTVYRYVKKLINEGVLVQTDSNRVYARFKKKEAKNE